MTFQEEHAKWLEKKYPNQEPLMPAVGCLEEAGELVHAILKIEQVNTWGEDTRHTLASLRGKLSDAIGDCGIYACSLCNANGWIFDELFSAAFADNTYENALTAAIELTEISCKVARYPTYDSLLATYLSQLKTVAYCVGLDAEICINTTWEIVKCR